MKTQAEFILKQLKSKGEISRNQCLRKYISRLGARIHDLRKMGFKFTTEHRKGDYVYKLNEKKSS